MVEKTPAKAPGNTVDIKLLYVKEQSCKVPHAPGIFQQALSSPDNPPKHSLEMNIQHQALKDNEFEVTLKLHITVTAAQQTAALIEVQQAGIFKLGQFEKESQAFVLGAYCPGILYPYARQIVSSLTLSAGLFPLMLPPINFDALYQQRKVAPIENEPTSTEKDRSIVEGTVLATH